MKKMTKNILIIITVTLILALALTACKPKDEGKLGIYDEFNKMAKEAYSKIDLTVCTQKDGVTLTDTYNFVFATANGNVDKNNGTITYVTQRLGEFKLENGTLVAPGSFIEETRGSATVANGKITADGDEKVYEAVSGFALSFNEGYFTDVVSFDGGFEAKVSKPADFFSAFKDTVKEMTVKVNYADGRFDKIQINCTYNDNSTGTINYNFE